jgi:hypothetical protein
LSLPPNIQVPGSRRWIQSTAAATGRPLSINIAGMLFYRAFEVVSKLREWSLDMPRDEYHMILNEAASKLTEVVDNAHSVYDTLLVSLYELAAERREEFKQ